MLSLLASKTAVLVPKSRQFSPLEPEYSRSFCVRCVLVVCRIFVTSCRDLEIPESSMLFSLRERVFKSLFKSYPKRYSKVVSGAEKRMSKVIQKLSPTFTLVNANLSLVHFTERANLIFNGDRKWNRIERKGKTERSTARPVSGRGR